MPRPQPLCWIDSQAPEASLLSEQLSLLGFDARMRSANDADPPDRPMCYLTFASNGAPQSLDQPWIALGALDGTPPHPPHAQLPWPVPLETLRAVLAPMKSRCTGSDCDRSSAG